MSFVRITTFQQFRIQGKRSFIESGILVVQIQLHVFGFENENLIHLHSSNLLAAAISDLLSCYFHQPIHYF